MKLPTKMNSGLNLNKKRPLSEIFYLTLLGLYGIIKRYGVKDGYLYHQHNQHEEYDYTLISSGIYFNLFSEYGVGKVMEPMLVDFMKDLELNPEKYRDNIFYKEVLKVVPEILDIVRAEDSEGESRWANEYATKNLIINEGELEEERNNRLGNLTRKTKSDKCSCEFCIDFRKHHFERPQHIDWYIIDVLREIDYQNNKHLV